MIKNDINYKNLENLIPRLLKIDLYKGKKFECCPHCQSNHFTKHGKYKGIQRYRCKECKKTFSNTTNSLWYYSKKDSNIWVKYIELFLQRKTLRECAAELKLNLATAFYWRHKILNILKSAHIYGINPEKLVGNISAETIYLHEGTYNSTINFKDDYYNQQKYIIAVAVCDSEGSMLIAPLSRFRFDAMKFNKLIISKIDPKSLIIATGRDRFLMAPIVLHNNKASKRWKSKPRTIDEKLNNIWWKISDWFCKFLGIATKYLESYLSYYILFSLSYFFESIDMSYSLVQHFGFIKTSSIKNTELIL
ncbi:MAG: IS1 family transposase [Romboutsia sp.]|nr:IS1 family transposase [Romboutsia sp.]